MRIAVVTIVHGRHDHLLLQQQALLQSSRRADDVIVVAMGDPSIGDLVPLSGLLGEVVDVEGVASALPLARARNAGAARALERGADLVVFLDVDCVPAPAMLGAYEAAALEPASGGRLLCGPVTYLEEPGEGGYDLAEMEARDSPHPARPAPEPGQVIADDNPDLFWSLSFAVREDVWRTIGGFDEVYTGYGAEDTDFARRGRRAGVGLAWVGGARAYHQWHPTQAPPVQHLQDIVRNANLFHSKWNEWPMRGWLDQFREMGLVRGGFDQMPCVTTAPADSS